MWEMWCGCRAYIDNSPLPPNTTFQSFIDFAHAGKRPKVPDATVIEPDSDYMKVIMKAWTPIATSRPSLTELKLDLGQCAYNFNRHDSDSADASTHKPNQKEVKQNNGCIIQ